MSRYTGPRARLAASAPTSGEPRAKTSPWKSVPTHQVSTAAPDDVGNVSEYLVQLQEKQKARFSYGLTEKQFRKLYEEASAGLGSRVRPC